MNRQDILNKYITLCANNLKDNNRILSILKNKGIKESYIFDNFNIGYVAGNLSEKLSDNKELLDTFESIGIIKNNQEAFINYLTIPIYDTNKAVINICYYNIHPNTKNRLQFINDEGIFNAPFLQKK